MTLNARVSTLLSRVGRGRRSLNAAELAVNFSFVLHDSSSSTTVRNAVNASLSHRAARFHERQTVLDGGATFDVDTWLTTSIGLPGQLGAALGDAGLKNTRLVNIDERYGPLQLVPLFRATAELNLPPSGSNIVGVAALVVRPMGRSRQLIVRGPFDWRSERENALGALEAIVQAHIDQWKPQSVLWPAPAEILLPGEVR